MTLHGLLARRLTLPDQREIYARLEELLQSIDSPICRMSRQLEDLDDQLKCNIIYAGL